MMGVSCVKAMLVILFFMHLLWEANWKFVLTIPAAMMSLFLVLMLIPDVGNRGTQYSEERTVYAADRVHAEEHGEHEQQHVESPDEHDGAGAAGHSDSAH